MNLKKTIAFWDRVMTSITYAEANEHETALQAMEDKKSSSSTRNDALSQEIHKTSLSRK